jgi:arginyl-tRNA synthetase
VEASDKAVTASGDVDDLDAIRDFAVAWLRREQDLDLKSFGVTFDVFFLESSLYESGAVDRTVQRLIDNGATYEQDGALWLRTTAFGDD